MDMRHGDNVRVMGAGPIGLASMQMARAEEAVRLIMEHPEQVCKVIITF